LSYWWLEMVCGLSDVHFRLWMFMVLSHFLYLLCAFFMIL